MPLAVMTPPVRPVPAVMLLTVPPVAPQPASRNELTDAGVFRVPLPRFRPSVSAAPLNPASFRLMMVASVTVIVGLPVMLRPQLGQLMWPSTVTASTALMSVPATSGAPVMPSA